MWPQGSQPPPLENQLPHNTQQSPKEEPSKRRTHPCPALNIQTCLNTDHEGPPKKRQPHIGVAQGLLQNQIQGLISLGDVERSPRDSSMQPWSHGVLAEVSGNTQKGP